MEKHNLPLGMVVGRMMHEMFRVLRQHSSETSDTKLTGEQFGILHVINYKKEACVQQELANMMGKDKSAILRLVDQLEEKNLVMRVADPDDRRKKLLHVTELGKEVIKQYMEMEAKISQELTKDISADDLDTFYRVISKIKSNAEQL